MRHIYEFMYVRNAVKMGRLSIHNQTPTIIIERYKSPQSDIRRENIQTNSRKKICCLKMFHVPFFQADADAAAVVKCDLISGAHHTSNHSGLQTDRLSCKPFRA